MKINCVECSYPVGLILSNSEDDLFQVGEEVRHQALCRDCVEKRFVERQKAMMAMIAGLTLAGGAIAWLAPANYNTWLPLNLALIGIFFCLSIIPHELGHAITARLLGMKLYSVDLGVGKPMVSLRLFGTTWNIRRIPTYGQVTTARTDAYSPVRSFLTIAAGPIANLLILLLLVLIGPERLTIFADGDAGLLLGFDLFLANALVLFSSLFPSKGNSPQGRTATDGMKLLNIIRSASDPDEAERAYWYHVGTAEYRGGNYEAARNCYERILEIDRYDPHAKLGLASMHLLLGNPATAREFYLELLERPKLSAEDRASLLNEIAFADLLTGDNALLDEADRFSEEALRFSPQEGIFNGTRGGVLMLRGEIEVGLLFLRKAVDLTVRPQDRGIDLLFIAYGEYLSGNPEEEAAAREEGERLAGEHRLAVTVREFLERKRQASAFAAIRTTTDAPQIR